MCRLRNSYAWLSRKCDYRTDRHTHTQTDAGQSDPYVPLCFAGDTKRKRSDSVLWQKPLHPQNNLKSNMQHKNATKNFDYTTIVDRLRTVSWSNSSHPTGVVKPGLRALNLPTHCESCVINLTWHDYCKWTQYTALNIEWWPSNVNITVYSFEFALSYFRPKEM